MPNSTRFINKLKELTDVSDTSPNNSQVLTYDESIEKWKPGTLDTGGGIPPSSCVFVRNGSGQIEEVNYTNGRNVSITRNLSGQVQQVLDSFKGTYTIVRDINDVITGLNFSSI